MATMRAAQVSQPNARLELVERDVPEPGFGQARVRDREVGLVENEVAVEEEIEVHRARSEARPGPLASKGAFHAEKALEKRARLEIRLERGGAVQEPRLVEIADGLGLAQGRHRDDLDARVLGEELERPPQRGLAIAEVRAESNVCAHPCSAAPVRRPLDRRGRPGDRPFELHLRLADAHADLRDGEPLEQPVGDAGGERLDQIEAV